MTQHAGATGSGKSTDGPLIASNRIAGTKVLDRSGDDIGTIKTLKIDKVSGRVAYVVAEFGGFLGMGGHEYTIPWGTLSYDPDGHGFSTDLTKKQLEGAPSSSRRSHAYRASGGGVGTGQRPEADTTASAADSDYDDRDETWDRHRDRELYDYYAVNYYWDE